MKFQLRHDLLAKEIHKAMENASPQALELRKQAEFVQTQYGFYQENQSLLDEKELVIILPLINLLDITSEEKDFVFKSEIEVKKQIAKERKRKQREQYIIISFLVILLGSSLAYTYFINKRKNEISNIYQELIKSNGTIEEQEDKLKTQDSLYQVERKKLDTIKLKSEQLNKEKLKVATALNKAKMDIDVVNKQNTSLQKEKFKLETTKITLTKEKDSLDASLIDQIKQVKIAEAKANLINILIEAEKDLRNGDLTKAFATASYILSDSIQINAPIVAVELAKEIQKSVYHTGLIREYVHPYPVNQALFAPQGNVFLTACKDGIRLFSKDALRVIRQFNQAANVDFIDFNPMDARIFLSASTNENQIKFWNINLPNTIDSIILNHPIAYVKYLKSGNKLLVELTNQDVLVIELGAQKVINYLGNTSTIAALNLNPQRDLFMIPINEQLLKIISENEEIIDSIISDKPITQFQFSPHFGIYFIATKEEKKLKSINLKKYKIPREYQTEFLGCPMNDAFKNACKEEVLDAGLLDFYLEGGDLKKDLCQFITFKKDSTISVFGSTVSSISYSPKITSKLDFTPTDANMLDDEWLWIQSEDNRIRIFSTNKNNPYRKDDFYASINNYEDDYGTSYITRDKQLNIISLWDIDSMEDDNRQLRNNIRPNFFKFN